MHGSAGLAAHDAAVARDREMLGLPPRNWPATVPGPGGQPMLDVLIVGAGMCGIAASAALLHKGIHSILVLDSNPDGQEGPWVTYARMETLRSPKHLPGPCLGIPSLTFRAWYEAGFGAAAWDALYKIPNAVWQDYLTWLKRVLALPVRNGVTVTALEPTASGLRATLGDGGVHHARRIVLANGRGGTGGLHVPDCVDPTLWPDLAAHTNEAIDFAALRGRRIAVIGGGPSAWDNAATALEAGAASAEMFVRRTQLPQVNKGRGSASPGFFEGWGALDPADKWAILAYMNDLQSPPPHETVRRALALPGFAIHLGTPVLAARRNGRHVLLDLPDRTVEADFLIVGSGFRIDLAQDPLLSPHCADIATWADRYTPPPDLVRADLGRFPWLGDGFELVPRNLQAAPSLGRVHLFNHGAMASLGAIASDIPGVNVGAERLASRLAQSLFREDIAAMRAGLEAFAEPELEGTPFFVPDQAGC
ncbi:MAG: NAD(P)/FAD-dependent oxidoreductase [Acetobacteraceae bacterium]|nr:NAD(P)/FAD-dependent oxidoreductase [Acetobacteraceae bacterium]